jgi:ABC-2 type transport system permease protein
MTALLALTIANIRSFLRNRAALFWTLAFPLIFILLFGAIFTGGGQETRKYAWVDGDGTPASAQLRAAFAAADNVELTDESEADGLTAMRGGEVRAVLVVPHGFGDAVAQAATSPGPPVSLSVYTDPTQQGVSGDTIGLVNSILGQINVAATGRGPAVVPAVKAVQTQQYTYISYLVPSILGMALMQLGIFASIPLVADREKLILKRLSATPLRRWQLVASNVLMRLLIAIAQTVIIVAVGSAAFHVEIAGSLLAIGGFVILGALTFIALGYVIASFTRTEDAANGVTSVVQFPMMFLSGTFFAIDGFPPVLKAVAHILPLTYLSDALRQVMVGGAPIAPLWTCFVVLAAFLVGCFAISARFFRWT